MHAEYEPIDAIKVPVPSTAGNESLHTMTGRVTIQIAGSTYRLTVIDDGDGGPFIPSRDGTSGSETYGGGRYVGIEPSDDATVTIDFNTAHNPWCVYDVDFTCPLPPRENYISEPIRAGEKMYEPPEQRD